MRRSTFKILFYVNKQRMKEGRIPVYARLTVNGQSTFVNCRLTLPPALWDSKANKAVGKSHEAQTVNRKLEHIRAQIERHYQRISDRDAYVTAERVKLAYLGMGEEYETLLEAFDKFNRDFKQHVGVDRAQSTYRKYDNVRKRLAEFLREKLNREDIPMKELTETFITDYDLYLRGEKGLTPSCVCIYTKPLKMIVTKAHNAGMIARNPFVDYHPKKTTKERGYLIESELQALMDHKFAFEGYGKVRDMFVFSCFTGMAHADVKGLTQEMIQRSFDGDLWIVKRRQKTDTPFKIKLCGITKRIIARYKREVTGTNLVLPVPDIAYCNRVLKKIAAEVGIDKTITYHMARHTFATTNALAQGIRIEVVSRMLGHTNIKTTQIYAKVTDDMLAKGFDEMADIYSAKYNLAR
ncbi:MAG: site-specific integrase [Alistipes sp.]|nr:site-specific integrase [Alistipes sp.]